VTGTLFICLAWLVWLAIWVALSLNTKSVVRREGRLSRALHLGPLVVAGALLLSPDLSGATLNARLLPRAAWMVPAGALLVACGLGFAVWARLVLAGNWSGTVTLKAAHELVRNGPYALARHPIYTGLLTALFGTMLAIDAWRGLVAFLIVALSFLRKMGTEEAFMRSAFGAQYDAYRAETAALVPWVW
jgi:protein-S-isoprenylcysteine O-methyltransferase Ste14